MIKNNSQNIAMNRKELKSYLDKMEKKALADMVLNINSKFPEVRKFISDTVAPPTIDWEQLYDECKDYVIEASLSNKINRIAVPGAALMKFTEYGPGKDIALDYLYETADIMVKGILFTKNNGSFNLSFVGGYIYECRKYMKKRKWLDADADECFRKIVARYFEPETEECFQLLLCSGLNDPD